MSNIYADHRVMNPSYTRFNELFESLKNEFDAIMRDMNVHKIQREDYEHKIQNQITEMSQIQKNIYELERAHLKTKQQNEDEINRLRRELEIRGVTISPFQSQSNPHTSSSSISNSSSNTSEVLSNLYLLTNGGGSHQPPNLGTGLLGHSQLSMNMLNNHQFPLPPSSVSSHYGQSSTENMASLSSIQSQGVIPSMNLHQSNQMLSTSKRSRPEEPFPPSQTSAIKKHQDSLLTQNEIPLSSVQVPKIGSVTISNSKDTSPTEATFPPQTKIVEPLESSLDQVIPFKKEGSDWIVLFNPNIPREINVNLLHSLEHPTVVCSVAFSADGLSFATGSNKLVNVYETLSGNLICSLCDDYSRDNNLYIRSICFSPNGRHLAAGAEDKKIRMWDLTSKQIVHVLLGHEQDIYSLQYSKNSKKLASGSGDRMVKIWDIDTGKCLCSLLNEDFNSKDSGVTSVCFSPDDNYIAAGSLDKIIRIWNTNTGLLVEKLEGHKDSVYSVAFSPDGKKIVAGSLDRTLRIWEFNPGEKSFCSATLSGHKDFVLSVAYSPDGQWIVSGSKDRSLQFWDATTYTTLFMLQGHKNSVISIAVNPKLGMFATGSGDGRARIWTYEAISNSPSRTSSNSIPSTSPSFNASTSLTGPSF